MTGIAAKTTTAGARAKRVPGRGVFARRRFSLLAHILTCHPRLGPFRQAIAAHFRHVAVTNPRFFLFSRGPQNRPFLGSSVMTRMSTKKPARWLKRRAVVSSEKSEGCLSNRVKTSLVSCQFLIGGSTVNASMSLLRIGMLILATKTPSRGKNKRSRCGLVATPNAVSGDSNFSNAARLTGTCSYGLEIETRANLSEPLARGGLAVESIRLIQNLDARLVKARKHAVDGISPCMRPSRRRLSSLRSWSVAGGDISSAKSFSPRLISTRRNCVRNGSWSGGNGCIVVRQDARRVRKLALLGSFRVQRNALLTRGFLIMSTTNAQRVTSAENLSEHMLETSDVSRG